MTVKGDDVLSSLLFLKEWIGLVTARRKINQLLPSTDTVFVLEKILPTKIIKLFPTLLIDNC